MKRLIVLLGVAGVSLSALLVRWSTAPSLILALYRMVFAAALMTPAALRGGKPLRPVPAGAAAEPPQRGLSEPPLRLLF